MLAYLRTAALPAPALAALVGAEARPQALLALAPFTVMLTYARSHAFLTSADWSKPVLLDGAVFPSIVVSSLHKWRGKPISLSHGVGAVL